jgi:hypothetical protein
MRGRSTGFNHTNTRNTPVKAGANGYSTRFRPGNRPVKAGEGKLPRPSRAKHAVARSAVTNGTRLVELADGRSKIGRRYRDLLAGLLSDQGGIEHCSQVRMALCRRFGAIAVLAEGFESRMVAGEPIDLADYALLCSTATRLASRLGIERISKDVTPDLQTYLRDHYAPDAEAAAE